MVGEMIKINFVVACKNSGHLVLDFGIRLTWLALADLYHQDPISLAIYLFGLAVRSVECRTTTKWHLKRYRSVRMFLNNLNVLISKINNLYESDYC
jgi:hypothetical protein